MKLTVRLRLCLLVLLAHRTRDWRWLTAACNAERVRCGAASLLAALQAQEDLDTERQQVAAGVRTTPQAAKLLAEAQALVQPKRPC